MKKLMLVAAMVAMCAMSAQAEWSCSIDDERFTPAKADTNPGDRVLLGGYYQIFIIQNAGADVNAVANYVKGSTVDQIKGEAKVKYILAYSGYMKSYQQYYISNMDASPDSDVDINPYQAYLVAFYGTPSETPTEFCVIGNKTSSADGSRLKFDDDPTKTYPKSGWLSYTAPVPEPTSGLLLLIGVAGLALKRKRA